MHDKALRRRCSAIISDLELPGRFTVENLLQTLQQQRGTTIHLLPITAEPGSPCGMWVSLSGTDYIFHEQGTTALHTRHIVLHELGHMCFAHTGSAPLSDDLIRTLLPHLNPALVRRMFSRSAYSEIEEQEAELFASLAMQHIHGDDPPAPSPPAEVAAIAARLDSTLQRPPREGA